MRESMQSTSKLLSIVFQIVSSLEEHEIDLLVQDKATLRVVEKNKVKNTAPRDNSHLDGAISDIAQKLSNAESRIVAEEILASIDQPRRKNFLIMLAKSCGVRVKSHDRVETIERKLVENVVGVRLDSEAINKVAF